MSGILALMTLLQLAMVPFGVTAESCNNDSPEGHCPRDSGNGFVQEQDWQNAGSMYDFHANDIHGNRVSLEKYRGSVCIVVNVARDCGLTETNFKQLVDLYDKYGDSGNLKILAFPCNQFGGQEPGTAEDILDYTRDYGVKFDIFEKIKVNGVDAHPLWKWLKQKQGGFLGNAIKWNFTKFIIDKSGQPVDRFAPTTEPKDLEETIKKYF